MRIKKKHQAEELEEIESASIKMAKSDCKIQSLLDDIFCNYDYDFDTSYLQWLLTSGENIMDPVLVLKSALQAPSVQIPDITEILSSVSMPADYIRAQATAETEEEELIIL